MTEINLLHGDCLELLKEIQSNSVDLVLTDPPYGTVKGLDIYGWKQETTAWDDTLNIELVFNELNRICKAKASILLFSQDPYTYELYNKQHNNLPFCYRLIWQKNHFANVLLCKKAPVNYYEDILVFRKRYDDINPNCKLRAYSRKVLEFIDLPIKEIFNYMGNRNADHFLRVNGIQHSLCTKDTYKLLIDLFEIDNMEGFLQFEELEKLADKKSPTFNLQGHKFKSNILKYSKESTRYHPAQKPIALLEDLIKTYSNKNDTVLDFTMGSGSTGVACKNLERNFIGIERDNKFFNIAQMRINNHIPQKELQFNWEEKQ